MVKLKNYAGLPAIIRSLVCKNEDVRVDAALTLLDDVSGDTSLPFLIKASQDDNLQIRHAAIFYLGLIRNTNAIEALLQILKSNDKMLCYAAGIALAKLKNQNAVPVLKEVLRKKNTIYRIAAATVLPDNINAKILSMILPTIIDGLGNEKKGVRDEVFKTIKRIDKEVAVKALLKVLNNDNKNVRIDSAFALYEMDNSTCISKAFPGVKEALNSKDEEIRLKAREALRKIRYTLRDKK